MKHTCQNCRETYEGGDPFHPLCQPCLDGMFGYRTGAWINFLSVLAIGCVLSLLIGILLGSCYERQETDTRATYSTDHRTEKETTP